jgi:glyoxylase-like metal-dependent hydrolase (beta-lactamase superfamily II)
MKIKAGPLFPDVPYAIKTSPALAYLIKGAGRIILVDTGASDPEWSEKYHHNMSFSEENKLENQLKKHGVTPDEIKDVILTHLHWDHAYGCALFKNAKFYVQKKEIDFAFNPTPSHYVGYEAFQMGLCPPWINAIPKFEPVDGDVELFDGISLVFIPGHTPGSQGVIVDTIEGKYLLAGDCVNDFPSWEDRQYGLPVVAGVHVDVREYFDTYRKILRMDVKILPGHDESVLNHPVYPAQV